MMQHHIVCKLNISASYLLLYFQIILKPEVMAAIEQMMEQGGIVENSDDDDTATNNRFDNLNNLKSESKGIYISTYQKKKKRTYNKQNACVFCGCLVQVLIGRHLLAVHKDEPDVAAIHVLNDQAERKRRLDLLRNRGNFLHNQQVIDAGVGQIILMRRPHTFHDLDYEDYGPCPLCLGYVLLKDIWRHTHYRCIARDSGQAQGGSGKGELQIQSQILANNKKMSGASEELKRHVLAKMRSSNISRIAKSDGAILELGNVWLKKVGGQRKSIVSSKMLSSSRMVDELRKLCPNEGEFISDFLKPKCFDAILEAANNLGGQDITETGNSSYEKPSTVLKLGHDMKKLATIKMCRALRTGDQNLEKEAKDYLFLHEKEWGVKMSCTALTTLRERKFNKGQNLPQTSDLVKLTEHVSQQLKLAMEEIVENVSNQIYKRLQKLCLVRLLLFNKRRPGELSQLTIKAYKERPNWADAGIQEVKDSFTSLEQKLLTAMDLVYIRGKRGTPVPVIIPEDCQQVFQQLIKLRSKVSIAHENSFLFAAMGTSLSFIRANDCLSEIVKDVDLAEPEKIKSTNMRKYLATVSQVLALKKNELDWLARHLGHDVQVHRQYYRLHESALELTKVAKLLMLTEKGKVGRWTGKSLTELTLEGKHALIFKCFVFLTLTVEVLVHFTMLVLDSS